jgi:chemotaxis protein CheD
LTQPLHPNPGRLSTKHELCRVFLTPGCLYCSAEPTVVTTVLGSCVAISLWEDEQRCGGVNHFLLPYTGTNEPSLYYGDYSTDRLIERMLRLGCDPTKLQAKVFGGASVLPVNAQENHVGARNVEFAFNRLAELGIPVVASCTGGQAGLLIRLATESGVVLVRPVRSWFSDPPNFGPDHGRRDAIPTPGSKTTR